MKRIGLTGGIGSGKTTVAKVLQVLGYQVYNSDEKAKYLVDNSPAILEKIKDEFGENVFDSNHKLARHKLANIVFNDSAKLKALNAIIHPFVSQDFEQWCANQNNSLVFKEAAIIFEHGLEKSLDEVWVVSAPENIRIQRVIDRSGLSEQEIRKRMSEQLPSAVLNAKATRILYNDSSKLLIPQIISALEQVNNSL